MFVCLLGVGLGVSYSIDAVQGLAYVEGKIESDVILKIMEKAGQHAQLWRIDSISSRDYHGNDDHDHDHGHANVNDDHTRDQINFNHHHHSTSVHAHEQPPLVPPAADTVSHKKPTNCCTM